MAPIATLDERLVVQAFGYDRRALLGRTDPATGGRSNNVRGSRHADGPTCRRRVRVLDLADAE
jgi:hypothetical protein